MLLSPVCVKIEGAPRQSCGMCTGGQYYAISGYGNFTKENYETRKSKTCRDRTNLQNDLALAYSSSSIVPQEARASYVECMSRQPLFCEWAPGQGSLVIRFTTIPILTPPSNIRSLSTINGKVLSGLVQGDSIAEGNTPVTVDVLDINKPFSIGASSFSRWSGRRLCCVFAESEKLNGRRLFLLTRKVIYCMATKEKGLI